MTPAEARAARDVIRARLPLLAVPGTGGLRLHLAAPTSGLSRLVPSGGTPYWAHAWPGGVALAACLLADPGLVRGRAVLDLGAGSAIAGIAAARAGARDVLAVDPDPLAGIVGGLNAAANGVALRTVTADPLDAAPGDPGLGRTQVILAGDVFYEPAMAARVVRFLDRWTAAGAVALVGDVGRSHLPRDRLTPLSSHAVRDVGDAPSVPDRLAWVHRWRRT